MSPEPAPGRARTSAEDAPSGVEELSECLGDERSARALVEWAETMAVTVRPLRPKWAPSGKGYTGAVLAAVTITPGPGIVVVKLCPADQRVEHAAHTRARRASELRGDFARQHLTQQLYPPHPVGDGRLLTFQSPAGDDLRNVVTMAQLNDEDLRSTFRTVVTGLVADWNQGLEPKDTELVSVSEFLRMELDTSVAEGGSTRAYGAGIENLRPDTAWIEVGDMVLPNPLTMTVGDAELPDPRIPVVHGLAHGDLHLHNALVPLRRGTLRPDAFRLIDLSTFAEDAPLTRDVATLMLSVLAERAPTGLIDEHELALLRHVVDPRDAYAARIVPELALLVDDLHSACADVASGGWQALWSDQLLLSVLATALRFTTYEDLGEARRWRFFRLAAHAGGELLSRHGVLPPSSAPAVSPPSQAGAAGRASTTTRATTVALREPDVHAATPSANAAIPPANAAAPPANRLPVPHMAPAVPTDFVDRPAEGTDLLRSLLAAAAAGERVPTEGHSAVGLTSSVTGVHGTGGFGKTTLAAWVCHHPEVRAAFPDGVLWAQLGQDPPHQRIIAWARDLVTLLTGTEPPVYATVEAAGEHLGATLEGRRVLLVVDDVWRREDVEPFLRGGSGCVRLVTTRRPGVLDASAPLIRIDRMSSAQSLNLLAAGVEGADNTTLLPLFERSGNWPLALRLLNGVLRSMVHRSGMALPDVVSEMAEELDRYGLAGPLDAYPAPGIRTVEATVDLSLHELARIPRTGRGSLGRLAAMACFPEDQHIPYRWLARLWGVSELTARRECVRLEEHSLLAQHDPEGVRLHDVIRDVLRRRDPEEVRQAHQTLLEGHAALCGGAGWHALAAPGADPAFLDNVTYHLAGALASTDLHHTTTDFRFLVERVWRSGPAALEAEAARYYSMFPVLRMDRFAMELGELVHGEAHLLAGHVRRLDLAVTLHSRCLAWKEVRRRLHHTHEVLRGGLVASEPFPDDPDGRLWRVLTGHTGPVHALCWRADGRVLVSGSGDGTLRIRRVDDERPDAVVDVAGEGDGSVVSLSWSPDVSTLAVGTDRGEVVLVDPSEHRITRRLVLSEEDQQRVMVAFTPDSRAVTVALGKEVRLWHEPYDKDGLGPPLPGPRDTSCTAVRWHEHGGLAVGLADGRVQLWERAATEAEPTVVDTGGPSVQALDWHPDGHLLAVIGHSATVTVIDRRSATVVARISGQARPGAAWFQSLCWTSSGDALLAGDNDGTVFVWKFTRQPDGPCLELEDTFSARGVQVRAIAPQPNEDRIAVGSRQPAVRLWILDRHSAPDAGLAERVNTVLWSPTGALAAGNAGGQLMVTDRGIGELPAWPRYAVRAHDGDLRAMAWAPDGGRLLSVGDDGRVLLWDAGRREVIRTLARKLTYAAAVAWSPDGRWAAAADTDVVLWETETWKGVHTTPLGASVNALSFAPDGSRLIAATSSMEVRVIHLDPGGRPTGRIDLWPGHRSSVSAVCWSHDGRHLATAGYDGHVLLWDPATGRPRHVLEGDGSAMWSVAVSRDGTSLVAVTMDGTAHLWDTGTAVEVCRLRVDGHLSSCSFHPFEHRLVLGGSAGLYACEVSSDVVDDR